MLWSEWKLKVLTYLDVDATRKGVEALRLAATKAAVIDLKHFVEIFKDQTANAEYADSDITPFSGLEEKAAEAAAMYIKKVFARAIDKDLVMMESYWKDYARIRRELVRDSQDIVFSCGQVITKNISRLFGDALAFTIVMEQTEEGQAWVDFSDYLMTFRLKRSPTDKDADACVTKTSATGAGISVAGNRASWEIATSALVAGIFYYTVKLERVSLARIMTIQQGKVTLEACLAPACPP